MRWQRNWLVGQKITLQIIIKNNVWNSINWKENLINLFSDGYYYQDWIKYPLNFHELFGRAEARAILLIKPFINNNRSHPINQPQENTAKGENAHAWCAKLLCCWLGEDFSLLCIVIINFRALKIYGESSLFDGLSGLLFGHRLMDRLWPNLFFLSLSLFSLFLSFFSNPKRKKKFIISVEWFRFLLKFNPGQRMRETADTFYTLNIKLSCRGRYLKLAINGPVAVKLNFL